MIDAKVARAISKENCAKVISAAIETWKQQIDPLIKRAAGDGRLNVTFGFAPYDETMRKNLIEIAHEMGFAMYHNGDANCPVTLSWEED